MMWLVGSSSNHPLNFGILRESLVDIGAQVGSYKMGSFVSFVKSRGFRLATYRKLGVWGDCGGGKCGGGTPTIGDNWCALELDWVKFLKGDLIGNELIKDDPSTTNDNNVVPNGGSQ
jgi:hypothetical protein